jgi:hypothetical protein
MYIYYNLLSKQLVTVPPKHALDMNGAGVYVQTAALIDHARGSGSKIASIVREAITVALRSRRSRSRDVDDNHVVSTTYHLASTAALKALYATSGLSYKELAQFICKAILHEGPIKAEIYGEITEFIKRKNKFMYFNWSSHKALYPVCATSKFEIEKFNELLEIPDILEDFDTHKEMLARKLLPYYGDLKYAFETGIINKAYTINVLVPEIHKSRLSPIIEEVTTTTSLPDKLDNKRVASSAKKLVMLPDKLDMPVKAHLPKDIASSSKAVNKLANVLPLLQQQPAAPAHMPKHIVSSAKAAGGEKKSKSK